SPTTASVSTPTPNVQGQWTGQWSLSQCSETGSASGVGCNAMPLTGPLSLTLTQTGSNVQGSLVLGQVPVSVSGPIQSGTLMLSGQGTPAPGATVTVNSWRSTPSGNSMTGSFTFALIADAPAGSITVSATIQSLTKSS